MILPIKKQWFNLIKSGIKTEEYREIKPYYTKRLQNLGLLSSKGAPTEMKKVIFFRNGYSAQSPTFWALCSLAIKQGKSEWGAVPGETYYTLIIHKIGVKEGGPII